MTESGEANRVGDDIKDYAWESLQEVDKHVRYYGELASKYQKLHSRIQLGVFVLALAIPTAIPILLSRSPEELKYISLVGIVMAALVGWDFIGGHANKAAVLHGVSLECDRIEAEQRKLFHLVNNDRIGEPEAHERLQELSVRTTEATGRAGYAQVSFDRKLEVKCWKDSKRVLMRQEPQNA